MTIKLKFNAQSIPSSIHCDVNKQRNTATSKYVAIDGSAHSSAASNNIQCNVYNNFVSDADNLSNELFRRIYNNVEQQCITCGKADTINRHLLK
ncbi:hypothetical protein DERP_012027 [Dermatophagoides pteronyssinus]|uniref:Uncharacterized protein n=1 Tax=Dermatophagoides pteronyssinus TaxID=6956 RepID=A0ABQ8IVM4_DERPT|nr:hypothetical protein DERP_012027 [Dermatophagoides pteronyssinus]